MVITPRNPQRWSTEDIQLLLIVLPEGRKEEFDTWKQIMRQSWAKSRADEQKLPASPEDHQHMAYTKSREQLLFFFFKKKKNLYDSLRCPPLSGLIAIVFS